MKERLPELLLNRHGQPVIVKKIAAKGKRGRLIAQTPGLNERSPFDRFASSDPRNNNSRSY